ncbi:hypothetical protein L2E82_35478 [Cichorium intybus]|uniref:Uncharacterized protein n=1 Tax=Cichorium intybus TaxID=13427 RepID=A0ACB9BNW0_CICIN|nr:hypothetical protein L2E82_35478 [Cichorium intybus]
MQRIGSSKLKVAATGHRKLLRRLAAIVGCLPQQKNATVAATPRLDLNESRTQQLNARSNRPSSLPFRI